MLHPQPSSHRLEVERSDVPTELGWCLDYFWGVRWDIAGRHVQQVIPRPAVHLVAELWEGSPRLVVHGVATRLFERELSGVGRVVAVAFRPGGFWPFLSRSAVDQLGGSATGLVNRVIPAGSLLGTDDRLIASRLLDEALPQRAAAEELARWLMDLAPPPDPVAERVAALVERAESDPRIVSTQCLADIAGVSVRTLQRLFAAYIGLSPKTVIQRHRLLDVAAAANAGTPVDWAELSAELGYFDQSHLIRHFKAMTGRAPASYLGAQREGSSQSAWPII